MADRTYEQSGVVIHFDDAQEIPGEANTFWATKIEIARTDRGRTKHVSFVFNDAADHKSKSKLYLDQMHVTEREIDVGGEGDLNAFELAEEERLKRENPRGPRPPGRPQLPEAKRKELANDDKTVFEDLPVYEIEIAKKKRQMRRQRYRQHYDVPTLKPNVNGGEGIKVYYNPTEPMPADHPDFAPGATYEALYLANCNMGTGSTSAPVAPRKGNYQEIKSDA